MHDAYFKGLSDALKRAGLMRPTLVIDRARLAANVAAIRRSVDGAKLPLRVVAKSLPSPSLLESDHDGRGYRPADGVQRRDAAANCCRSIRKPTISLASRCRSASSAASSKKSRGGARVQWLIDTPRAAEPI